jgi:hypothetical protein
MLVRLLKHVDTTGGPKGPGDEIEHPDAHLLCCSDDPVAEPIDEEATVYVDEWRERHKQVVAQRVKAAKAAMEERLAAAREKAAKRTERFGKTLEP